MDPIPDDLLGQYQCTSGNSFKFWSCEADGQGLYIVKWGAIGTKGQSMLPVDRKHALTKIREKLRNDYVHTISHERAVVALERLTLEALFHKGSTALKRKTRTVNDDGKIQMLVAPAEVIEVPVARPRRRL